MRNYQKELDKIIEEIKTSDKTPSLLLHSCCAPCSSYCLEYLAEYFKITVFYYNPNIFPESEYALRVEEQKRLIKEMKTKNEISFLEIGFNPEEFYAAVKGHEKEKEGGERCFACYRLRLSKTAEEAKKRKFDYFATTLTISPLKNADKLNETGEEEGEKQGVKHLPSDFKKKNGYKRSTELSKQYGLYRQDYCGCVYSKKERELQQTT